MSSWQRCMRIAAGDGDKKARSPGRARRKPLKPFVQGVPETFGVPVVTTLVCFFQFAYGAAGAAEHPAFPAPSFSEGRDLAKTRVNQAAGTRRLGCLKIEPLFTSSRTSEAEPSAIRDP